MASEEVSQQDKTGAGEIQDSQVALEMLTRRLQEEEDRWKEKTFAHCCHLHRLQHENLKKQGTVARGVSVEKPGPFPAYIEVLHAACNNTVTPTVRFRITRELRAANLLDFAQYVYSSYLGLDLASLSLSSKKLNKVFNTKTKHVLMGEALKDFTTIGGSHHPVFHMSVDGKEKSQQQTPLGQSKGLKMSQKEALCVEGDIQRINGSLPQAVSCYCRAYEEDPLYVIDHLKSLPQESLESVVELVDFWGRSSAEAAEQREEYGISLTPEQLTSFILSCPASLIGSSSCARISQLFKEKKYQEVIEKCSAILEHQPAKPVRLYLDRGLAALLARKRDRVVAADFIKAFKEDENELKEYMLAQKQHLPRVLKVLHRCASLDQPKRATSTEDINKWQSFVIDCGKIILLFDPYDGKTMTRCATLLADLGDFSGATEMWTNMLKLLRGQETPSKGPMIDTLVARALCHYQLGKLDYATTDLIAAVNIDPDAAKTEMMKDFAKEQLKEIVSYVVGLARKMSVGVRKESQAEENTEMGDQVRAALQLYKLVLALQTNNRKVLHACAECHTFLGEHQEAADIYATMLQNDTRTDTSTLCSRALSNLKAGHLDIAMSDLNIAFDRNPSCIDALCARAYFFKLKGQEDDLINDVLNASLVSVKDTAVSLRKVPVPDQGDLKKIIIRGCQRLLQADKEGTMGEVAGLSVKREKTEAVLRLTELLQLLSPGTEGVHLLRAHAHMELGNQQEAQRILLDKVKSNPQDPVSSVHLAMLRVRLGKVQEAVQGCISVLETHGEATFHTALVDVPQEDRLVLLRSSQQYGFSLVQQSHEPAVINTAISAFTIATLASETTNTTSLMARAECHAHLRSYQAAAQDYTRVIKAQTECSTALCARGCMNIVMNKQKDAVEDFLAALRKDLEAARTQILLLQQQMRLLLLYWLHLHATDAMSGGTTRGLEDAVLIGRLLISINADVAAWQLLYADALIIQGDLDQAFLHLNRVLQLTPDDRSVLARRGLIYVKKGNYQLAASELSPLAELDTEGLEFVLKALDANQRDSLVKVSLKKAEVLTGLNDHEQALCYLTLAVAASQSSDADVLRQRTKCLSRLQQYDQALHDINLVIKMNNANKNASQVSDYCWRGYINLLRNKEHPAVVDYVLAFKTDRQKTVSLVTSRPGKTTLAQVFHRYAEHQYTRGKTEDTIAVCQLGLLLDGTNENLRSLKMKATKDQAHTQCTIL